MQNSCVNEKSKSRHVITFKIPNYNSLYLEKFQPSKDLPFVGGAISTYYLTDSSSFRVFIGQCDIDNEEMYQALYKNDSTVIIQKLAYIHLIKKDSTYHFRPEEKILMTQLYNITQLKREKKNE